MIAPASPAPIAPSHATCSTPSPLDEAEGALDYWRDIVSHVGKFCASGDFSGQVLVGARAILHDVAVQSKPKSIADFTAILSKQAESMGLRDVVSKLAIHFTHEHDVAAAVAIAIAMREQKRRGAQRFSEQFIEWLFPDVDDEFARTTARDRAIKAFDKRSRFDRSMLNESGRSMSALDRCRRCGLAIIFAASTGQAGFDDRQLLTAARQICLQNRLPIPPFIDMIRDPAVATGELVLVAAKALISKSQTHIKLPTCWNDFEF